VEGQEMTFTVYNKYGASKDVTDREFDNLVKENGLMDCDLDQFAITEDGQLIILDDCGNFCYVPPGEYKIMIEEKI
jgi:hypothetical protein